MSKRKSFPRLKKPSSKMAANAKQATVKGPRHTPVALAENSSALTPVSERELPVIEIPEATTSEDQQKQSDQEGERLHESQKDDDVALAAESSTASAATHPNAGQEVPGLDISSQHELGLSDPEANGFDVFSATAAIQAYQAKLLEIYSANMQLAFEFAVRLVTVASPVELLAVTSELTSKRVRMFLEQSERMTELLERHFRGA